MESMIAWIMSFMVVLAPPGRPQYLQDAKETEQEARARYESIANDLQEVVLSESPVFKGDYAYTRTTAILLSLMLHESAFRRDVDYGLGPMARGDNGRSWCLMQINVGKGRTMKWNRVQGRFARHGDNPDDLDEGWTGPEMVADRKKCIRAGLRLVRGTLCTRLPQLEWLRSYASGSCNAGSDASRKRMGLAISWFSRNKPPMTDEQILTQLKRTQGLPEDLSVSATEMSPVDSAQ